MERGAPDRHPLTEQVCAETIMGLIHTPNTTPWQCGDLVIHDADAKRIDILMIVVSGSAEGVYPPIKLAVSAGIGPCPTSPRPSPKPTPTTCAHAAFASKLHQALRCMWPG